MKRFRVVAAFVVVVLLLVLPAAASSWQENEDRGEIEQGREADQQIEALYGFYEDAELTAYVADIGNRMAALSERPNLPWTFRVLDSPVINAFALPGGFVYVTRGLVAYAGNEAELAGVIGHEIGHVTGKHSRGRRWGSILATIGIIAGAVLSDAVRDLVDLGVPQLVATLALTKYSRGHELDADRRGIRYAAQAGYNPYAIGGFFQTLQSLEEHHDRKKLPGWISTHPQIDDRIERSNRRAREVLAEFGLQDDQLLVGRRALLEQVDAVVFGENPRQGYMDGVDFLHPDLGFRLAFPADWSVENGRSAIIVSEPADLAYMKLEIVSPKKGQDPYDYARSYVRELGAKVVDSERIEINGLEAVEVGFTLDVDGTEYAVLGNWISFDGRLYQLLGVTTPRRWRITSARMQRSMYSFRELEDEAVLETEPARVAVIELSQTMTLAGVVEAHPEVSVPPEIVAILNHMSMNDLIVAGDAVKLVFGGPGRR